MVSPIPLWNRCGRQTAGGFLLCNFFFFQYVMMTKPTDIQDFLCIKRGLQGWVTHLNKNCTRKTHFLLGQPQSSGGEIPQVTTQTYPNKTPKNSIRCHMNDMNDKPSSS